MTHLANLSEAKCIVCQDRPTNPQIGSGKSFCSRICEYLYFDVTFQHAGMEFLKSVADRQHSELADDRKYS